MSLTYMSPEALTFGAGSGVTFPGNEEAPETFIGIQEAGGRGRSAKAGIRGRRVQMPVRSGLPQWQ